MAQTGTPRPAGSDQSLGELVAQAAKDVSQLIRGELNLAKAELRSDVRRIGVAAGLLGMAGLRRLPGARHALLRLRLRPAGARHLALGLVPHRRRRLPGC